MGKNLQHWDGSGSTAMLAALSRKMSGDTPACSQPRKLLRLWPATLGPLGPCQLQRRRGLAPAHSGPATRASACAIATQRPMER
eukprot:scaffold36446_cov35-Tisochrysis_lutea.AAC.2